MMGNMNSFKKDEVSVKGKIVNVESNVIDGKTIVISGKILKIARIKDEICDSGVSDPEIIIAALKKQRKADIFTFDQKIPDVEPKYDYYHEWENFAVLKIEGFDDWWNNKIKNDARRMVRKAKKKGVVVKVSELTDNFVEGIKGVYDETPIRQGKPFWHYRKEFETVKRENSTYLDRSGFIGAFLNEELIGFDKIFFTGDRADTIQLIAKNEHRDKAPTNALISESIDLCAKKGISYLTYGRYSYGKRGADSLKTFKKRSGFEPMELPRYYVPLTIIGRLAILCRLHRNVSDMLPKFMIQKLLNWREKYYTYKYRHLLT